jgi:hypothetical protein
VVAVAAVPGVAGAATIGTGDDGVVQYAAAAGESNRLALVDAFGPTTFTFADAGAPLTAGPGCVAGLTATVVCPVGPISAALKDGDDRASVNSFAGLGTVTLDGDGGDDDLLAGSQGSAVARGGSGDDTLVLSSNGGGFGYGQDGDDRLAGRSGGDTLSGGRGDDLLTKRPGLGSIASLSGDEGADRIVALGTPADSDGGPGSDLIIGGARISGGGGSDQIVSEGGATIDAGAGNDVIAAGDLSGNPDTISCGSGWDVVWFDAGDTVARDCEVRLRRPSPKLPGVDRAIADAQALLSHTPTIG